MNIDNLYKSFKVENIVWDLDDGDVGPDENSCIVNVCLSDILDCPDEASFEELLSDTLSDNFDFAVTSFTYETL